MQHGHFQMRVHALSGRNQATQLWIIINVQAVVYHNSFQRRLTLYRSTYKTNQECMRKPTFVRGTSTCLGTRNPASAANFCAASSLAFVNRVPSTKRATHRVLGNPFRLAYPSCRQQNKTISEGTRPASYLEPNPNRYKSTI